MPFILPDTDLSQANVGTSGFIDLSKVGIGAGATSTNPANTQNLPSVLLLNDSSCNLQITFDQSGQGFTLPSGAWIPAQLPLGTSKINYVVLSLNMSKLLATLHATYFQPGEQVTVPQTGNNPTTGAQNKIFIDTQNAASAVTITYTNLDPTKRIYLLGFDITGDKAAAANTGQVKIQNLVDPVTGNTFNDLIYYINQGTGGTTPYSIRFPFQACSGLGNANGTVNIKIVTPSLSAGAFIVIYQQIY